MKVKEVVNPEAGKAVEQEALWARSPSSPNSIFQLCACNLNLSLGRSKERIAPTLLWPVPSSH